MSGYWPWWLGALVLGAVTVGYTLLTARPLGVSGAYDRALLYRRARRVELLDDALPLLQRSCTSPRSCTCPASGPLLTAPAPPEVEAEAAARRPLPVVCSVVLLVAIVAGGFLGAVTSGRFELRGDMGPGFAAVVTANPVLMYGALFGGGLLVGFGTRMAGGCTSGHGLTGCSRLVPASLLATAVFFGTGVVVSVLLWKVV